MAIDKAVDSAKLDAALVATADAIRAKGGGTAKLAWKETNGFADEIDTLPEDVPEVTQATPSITVSSGGLITASATQSAGKVAAGTKSATKQLTAKAAATYTPKTTNQTIAAGQYLTGAQTIAGDANLVAANIVKGKSIFGVAGSAATAVAGKGTMFGRAFESGTFTPSSQADRIANISHSLGVVPTGLILWSNSYWPQNYGPWMIFTWYDEFSTWTGRGLKIFTSNKYNFDWSGDNSINASSYTPTGTSPMSSDRVLYGCTTSKFSVYAGNYMYFQSGYTYNYILFGR